MHVNSLWLVISPPCYVWIRADRMLCVPYKAAHTPDAHLIQTNRAREREKEWHFSTKHNLSLFWEDLSEHLLLWAFLTLLYGIQFQPLTLLSADYKTHWWKQALAQCYPCVHRVIGFESKPYVTTICKKKWSMVLFSTLK